VAAKRLGVFDPSGRLFHDLAAAADRANLALAAVDPPGDADVDAVLVAPALAAELGAAPDGAPPRWIVGDAGNAARVAGAAATAGAQGVLLGPLPPEALAAIVHPEPRSAELDLARARSLVALSLVDLTGAANDTLRGVAESFTAHDCIVWWKDGAHMTPTGSRPNPNDTYRTQVATAARIAAACGGTAIIGAADPHPRSVIADALRGSPTEVSGMVALVSDVGRRFSAAERTDVKALATRLTRELSWLTSHRRIVAEGERLLASSLHDPLTGAMTRGAFEQTLTHEVAGAGRRGEKLTLAVLDVVGLRRINLAQGHRVGDEVLAQIASRLRATVRGNDPIGRPGGDELGVLLVGANEEQAALVVRKILLRAQSEPIRIDGQPELTVQMRAIVTELAPGERSGEAALARCYGALRTAPIGDVRTVPASVRTATETELGMESGLSTGTIVGGTYRVTHELSRGAMGVVYRGEDLGLGRPVAIKVLRSDLASDRDLVDRFRAEAAMLASLHHRNLVQVYALGEHAGEVYFVMELVEGQPLSEVLRATLERREWFPVDAVAQIALEIGDALDAMHALGLIHRDVKPANVLLDRERDRAVLVDVGVAVKAGDTRDAAGTPGFAAPESFLAQEGGPPTDVYGLAATMYCALTGRPPFGSGPAPQVVQRQLNDPLVPPSQLRPGLSEAVDAVLAKALAASPKRRWASASTFALALGRALERKSGEIRLPQLEPVLDVAGTISVLEAASGFDQDLAFPSELDQVIGRVRAAHLRVLTKILQHQLGTSALAKLRDARPELAGPLSSGLSPLAWVDLKDLIAALHAGGDLATSGVLPRKVGRGTMSATFARMFGADPASLPAQTVLAALPTFWGRYHEWGDVTADVTAGAAAIRLSGFSGSTDICMMVAAELERVVELTGAQSASATHPHCRHHGAAACEFHVSWT
jgi:diguanylate cyclase (GGDEF)-like protein